jgi:xanthosine utilization system XapX-like protein
VRSPAARLIAFIGLLGMVLGEEAIEMAKRQVSPFPKASVEQSSNDTYERR